MLHKIIEILKNEDTFNLFFYNNSPMLIDLQKSKVRTLDDLKSLLLSFYKKARETYAMDSLYWNEASKLEKFTYRLFREIENIQQESNGDDFLVGVYTESILKFTEGIEVPLIDEQVAYIVL